MENRRLQKILLRTKFPSLARLPLDHSSFDTTPLEPSTRQRLKHYLLGDSEIWKLSRYGRRVRRDLLLLLKQQDPRYYYRIWNMNNPGWQAIRILAEPLREEIAGIFNADQLNKLLPDPEAHISVYNSAIDTSGLKTLLGIMLWSKEHARASYKNCN